LVGVSKIKKSYKKLEEVIFDTAKNISNFTNINNKLCPFDTRLRIVNNKYLDFGLCINNLANQVVESAVNIDKSSFAVNGLIIATERLKLCKNNLYPFATHKVWVQIMSVETIPVASEFEISCKMHIDYNAFLQPLIYSVTCQFKGIFIINIDDKGEKSIDLIKVIQPASPID
jgi:hypothetical protein